MSLPSSAPRRISYVIPAPSAPPPRLVLPPLDAPRSGRTVPLIIPAQTNDVDRDDHLPPLSTATLRPAHGNPSFSSMPSGLHHPRHRLGVSALALDTSTQLEGRSCPEGILYSGGRDGLILAWELGIPMKRRMRKYGAETSDRRRRLRRKTGTWETMTGWDDYDDDDIEDAESSEDEEQISSPWVLGALRNGLDDLSPEIPFAPGPDQKELVPDSTIPYESRWQADASRLDYAQPVRYIAFVSVCKQLMYQLQRAYFRQCVQPHTDWVNDILLCNMNQTRTFRNSVRMLLVVIAIAYFAIFSNFCVIGWHSQSLEPPSNHILTEPDRDWETRRLCSLSRL
jgi:WD repeat-containing protein 48